MSLFSQLQRLYRPDRFLLEDFHTEIVAQTLRNSSALTLAWLNGIGATNLPAAAHIEISTQQTFEALPGHATASRPDIAIRLAAGGKKELILVESKLPSTQGFDQLQRYAEHLQAAEQSGAFTKTCLVFITRDHEEAAMPLLSNPQFKLIFLRTRWFQFYRYLKAHANGDSLVKELMLFMQENRMSLGNQFRSTDLVALENFLGAKALMDETLQGEVTDATRRIHGSVTKLKKALDELRDEHRYILSSWGDATACLVGYWLPHENPDEPIWVGVRVYSVPGAAIHDDVIAAFRGWLEKTGGAWSARRLDEANAWGCIYKGEPIQALMGGADHVRATKDYLLSLLKEVEAFRNAYPALHWGVPAANEALSEE